MKSMKIALSGKSGAGKTELARYLVDRLGIQRCSPGDIYRTLASILFLHPTKEAMNRLTVALRSMDSLCVTSAALRQMSATAGVVFDSMRFKEDYSYFKAQGYVLVRIECDANVRAERLLSRGEVQDDRQLRELERDLTETDLDEKSFDLSIVNCHPNARAFVEHAFAILKGTLGEG